jgi:D-serine deaminase-like pyridoxal phosphate-dependent protein
MPKRSCKTWAHLEIIFVSGVSVSKSTEEIEALATPCLLLDRPRMERNISRLKQVLHALGVGFRPHLKTAKSIDIAQLLMPTASGPCTVSTLKEAEQFAAGGVRDILYAVGIAPSKLSRVVELRQGGVDLCIILDSLDQAEAVVAACNGARQRIPVLIAIDSDWHRSVIGPNDTALIEVGRRLHEGGAELRGVMTHAGASYDQAGASFLRLIAEQERAIAVMCAERLRAAGFPCPVVSVGSTPTAHFARDLHGVTEVRAGVFVFFDLVMHGVGVCAIDDIALSVLSTVIGHQREKGWIVVDAGWTALSQDRGTSRQSVDQGYGLVCDVAGRPYGDLVVRGVNQEHGILAIREGSDSALPELAVGTLVRILPNHACATADQFEFYHVLDEAGRVSAIWPRFSGW